MTKNIASICLPPPLSSTVSGWNRRLLFVHINMLGSDIQLQHEHWIQWVTNLKITNNKSLVTSLLFTGDVSTITANLSLITDMLAAMKSLWMTIWHRLQPTTWLTLHRVHCLFFQTVYNSVVIIIIIIISMILQTSV